MEDATAELEVLFRKLDGNNDGKFNYQGKFVNFLKIKNLTQQYRSDEKCYCFYWNFLSRKQTLSHHWGDTSKPYISKPKNQNPKVANPNQHTPKLANPNQQTQKIANPNQHTPKLPKPNQQTPISKPQNWKTVISKPQNQQTPIRKPQNWKTRISKPQNQLNFI